jgi:hypothetical protein
MKDPVWRAEHAAAPGTVMNGHVCGCTNHVGVNGDVTGKVKTCQLMKMTWVKEQVTRATRHHFETTKALFVSGKLATREAFATAFRDGLQRSLDHCFDDHTHCTAAPPSCCSRAPDRRQYPDTSSSQLSTLVTCPAAQRAARALVDECVHPTCYCFACRRCVWLKK